MMRTVAAGENEVGPGTVELRREQQLGIGHEHRMCGKVMWDDGAPGPQPTLHRKSMRHSRFRIERKVEDLPRAGVSSVTPEIAHK